MTNSQVSPKDAAIFLLEHRNDILEGKHGDALSKVSTPGDHVDAGLLRDRNILLITGSDSFADYLFYNLRPFRPIPRTPEIDILTLEFPRKAYHKGFLLHAARILSFLDGHKPSSIVGHSLGAAAAQILGTALAVPTICLASPQVIKRRFLEPDHVRKPSHPQWNVLNIAWKQDFVTRGFRMVGFRALGHRMVLDFKHRNPGIDHFVKHYKELVVADTLSPTPRLPAHWPDESFQLPTRLA